VTTEIVFHPDAALELLETTGWYARRSRKVAARFATEMELALARIADNPRRWPQMTSIAGCWSGVSLPVDLPDHRGTSLGHCGGSRPPQARILARSPRARLKAHRVVPLVRGEMALRRPVRASGRLRAIVREVVDDTHPRVQAMIDAIFAAMTPSERFARCRR